MQAMGVSVVSGTACSRHVSGIRSVRGLAWGQEHHTHPAGQFLSNPGGMSLQAAPLSAAASELAAWPQQGPRGCPHLSKRKDWQVPRAEGGSMPPPPVFRPRSTADQLSKFRLH